MAMDHDLEKIQRIFAKVLHVDGSQVTESTSMQNLLHWDSLNHLGLVIEIEKEFSVRFKAHQLAQITSVKQILTTLSEVHEHARHPQA
jgi:acyl carrier protein